MIHTESAFIGGDEPDVTALATIDQALSAAWTQYEMNSSH